MSPWSGQNGSGIKCSKIHCDLGAVFYSLSSEKKFTSFGLIREGMLSKAAFQATLISTILPSTICCYHWYIALGSGYYLNPIPSSFISAASF